MSKFLLPTKYLVQTKAKMVVDSGMNDIVKENDYTKYCKHILYIG